MRSLPAPLAACVPQPSGLGQQIFRVVDLAKSFDRNGNDRKSLRLPLRLNPNFRVAELVKSFDRNLTLRCDKSLRPQQPREVTGQMLDRKEAKGMLPAPQDRF